MSSLEPPVPAATADEFATTGDHSGSRASMPTVAAASKRWQSWRRVVGLLLLGLTVFLWTASNFLASTIFADDTYSKPFFVTYVNTSFFIVPLIPILVRQAYREPQALWQYWASGRQRVRAQYVPLRADGSADDSVHADSPRSPRSRWRRQSMSASEELLLGDSLNNSSHASDPKETPPTHDTTSSSQLTLPATARLSLEFCLLWFLANYFVAACLKYTTVASSTILTSTSSVFTLLFGSLSGVERFTLRKLLAVCASLTGIILISSVDLSGQNTDDEHRGDFPEKTLREVAIGDALALLSAVLYGIYAVFLKRRIADESRVNMPLFFGLVGLFNVLLLWPGFIILHLTGAETFEVPPSKWVTTVIMCNSTASLISDLAWAYAVLLTSPIVVTVGLSMTIPLSLIGQTLLNSQTASPLYWVGAAVVVLSFIFVNQEEKGEEVGRVPEGGDAELAEEVGGEPQVADADEEDATRRMDQSSRGEEEVVDEYTFTGQKPSAASTAVPHPEATEPTSKGEDKEAKQWYLQKLLRVGTAAREARGAEAAAAAKEAEAEAARETEAEAEASLLNQRGREEFADWGRGRTFRVPGDTMRGARELYERNLARAANGAMDAEAETQAEEDGQKTPKAAGQPDRLEMLWPDVYEGEYDYGRSLMRERAT
ncbi:hypothetical protein B0A55_04497 [Friedmanniomyces simplex]|uniref:DUF3955 domain-containing protein n=1 Tax=Friedmanniomyces simplex TaxID=329884 RepID=A0A4U0XUF2_9PEZI|nr:hypothetical protein B0A55_04497 [Friedmanniomyces simplex]